MFWFDVSLNQLDFKFIYNYSLIGKKESNENLWLRVFILAHRLLGNKYSVAFGEKFWRLDSRDGDHVPQGCDHRCFIYILYQAVHNSVSFI